jgi:hypothetical protein
MSRNTRFLGLVAASMLFACGSPMMSTPDAATDDAGTNDSGGPGDGGHDGGRDAGTSICTSPRAVTLTTTAMTITGNTTGGDTSVARLDGCAGDGTDPMDVPREVVAVTLPGTASDMVGVLFDMGVDGTAADFDSVVEIRPACASATDAICVDDGGPADDYRSTGTFLAPGGSTVFVFVGGYLNPLDGYVNSGAWAMEMTAFINPGPPTYTSGEATLYDGEELVGSIMGTDPAGAASAVRYSFLDSAGTAIGFDLDADTTTPDDIELDAQFRPSVIGMPTFTGTLDVTGFGEFPQALMATQLRVTVLNAFGQMSAEGTIPLVMGTTVGIGAACDATHRCADTLSCTAAVCTATPEAIAACATPTPVVITPPTTTATSAMTTAMLDTSEGALEGSCVGRGGLGDEAVFTVNVPAVGAYDLLVDTNGAMTGTTDTMVYDRIACLDPSTETECNDDDGRMPMADPRILASYLEILDAAAGDHTIVVDAFETLTAAVTVNVTVTLRPVLPSASPCDIMGIMNRCAAGTCMDGTAICP